MRRLSALLGLVCLLCTAPLRAEPVGGLYEAEVPVASQDNAARDAAVRAAFRDVLVKLAGTRRVLDNPAVAQGAAGASSYLVQFFFRRAELPPGEDGAPPQQQPVLHASFQPAPVERLLRDAGEPLLSANRPGVLVWLAIDDGSGARRLLNRESDPLTAAWLDRAATARAVPVLYPLLDLEEPITADQVWESDDAALTAASGRYAAPIVLAGRLVRGGEGEWIGEWRSQIGEERAFGQGRAATRGELAAQLVDFAAEAMSARFAIRSSLENAEELRIRVDGIGSFAAYHDVAQLLGRLGSVRQARPALFEGDTVFFDLLTESGIDSVLQEIALLGRLQPEGDPAERRYRWNGG
jgi:hypothetical protein